MRIVLAAVVALLVLSNQAEAETRQLAGSERGFQDETGDRQRSVQFGANGEISGSGGCNRFAGRYAQTGGSLEISGLRTTLMACAPEVMAREGALMAALEAARKVETSHLVLKIYAAADALLLDLVRRDFD